MSHSFGEKYLELVVGERLGYTDKFEDANLPAEMQVTVALKQVSVEPSGASCTKASPTPFRGSVLSRLAGFAA